MTQQEIIEGNKLIAIFDNPQWNGDNNHLEYHCSWDCLMPVVEKIWNVKIDEEDKRGYEYKANASDIINSLITLEINAVWRSTVDFLTWHNQKKTT